MRFSLGYQLPEEGEEPFADVVREFECRKGIGWS